jgi:hypothetical protein
MPIFRQEYPQVRESTSQMLEIVLEVVLVNFWILIDIESTSIPRKKIESI